ncbi:MAG TPA: helix-turn-helix domain-containing protein [Dehalococcoidia bacterium]|nr:helix-turn-helix domain-containing protein [Dehalococcoidia bacterium]
MALSNVSGGTDSNGVRVLGNLSLNLGNYRVAVADQVVDLSYHELELLRLLAEYPNSVISYSDITNAIWGNSSRSTLRALNVLVHRLRTKLANSHPYIIETVRGRGYGLLKSREAENVSDWT